MPIVTAWSDERMRRFAQHVLLPDVGGRGQDRLRDATVAVHFDGPAARLAALYLAAGGVGDLVLVGADRRVTAADARFPIAPAALGGSLASALADALVARGADVVVTTAAEPPAGVPVLVLADDRDDASLAEAFARGGEAAARLLHALATGAA